MCRAGEEWAPRALSSRSPLLPRKERPGASTGDAFPWKDTAAAWEKCLPVPQACQMVPAILGGADSVVQWWELASWGTEGSGFRACHLASVQLKGVLAVQPGQQVRVTGAEDGKGGPAAHERRCWGSARAPTTSWDSGWSADWEGSGQRGTGWLGGGSQRSKTRDIKMTEWTGHATQLVAAFSLGSGTRPGFESWLSFLAAV